MKEAGWCLGLNFGPVGDNKKAPGNHFHTGYSPSFVNSISRISLILRQPIVKYSSQIHITRGNDQSIAQSTHTLVDHLEACTRRSESYPRYPVILSFLDQLFFFLYIYFFVLPKPPRSQSRCTVALINLLRGSDQSVYVALWGPDSPTGCGSLTALPQLARTRREKDQSFKEKFVALLPNLPHRCHHHHLNPSGPSPPRWVACWSASNSESDINAWAASQPKGQFDLQEHGRHPSLTRAYITLECFYSTRAHTRTETHTPRNVFVRAMQYFFPEL